MAALLGSTFVGLTDDPIRRRRELGDPPDWIVEHWFWKESEAQAWARAEAQRPEHSPAPTGNGWRFGYKFTVVESAWPRSCTVTGP